MLEDVVSTKNGSPGLGCLYHKLGKRSVMGVGFVYLIFTFEILFLTWDATIVEQVV